MTTVAEGMAPTDEKTVQDPSAKDNDSIASFASMQRAAKTAVEHKGLALCLSGGGFRAMLYHVGALWRLNELGLLNTIKRISSVSGGSITSAWLALIWARRGWRIDRIPRDQFWNEFAAPLRYLAARQLDVPAVLRGFAPWRNVGREMAEYYDRFLFRGATLQDLPGDSKFVILASNLQTGALWRFSKAYMGDYKVGRIENPTLPLAEAVAASSAFPPMLSPFELKINEGQYRQRTNEPLHFPPYTTRPILSDGGVYDNVGLEPLKRFTKILASDGGRPFSPNPSPCRGWLFQTLRVLDCFENQVQCLRVRDLIDHYKTARIEGCYWGIATPLCKYRETLGLRCADGVVERLANVSTRLSTIAPRLQEEIINWGYASCAASVATNYPQAIGCEAAWPYPKAALG